MEQTTKPKALIVLLLIILNHTCLVQCRNLPPSPSPSPSLAATNRREGGKEANQRLGSFADICETKCKQCKPCVPVEVTIKTIMSEEENEYYPIAWKCMCHTNIFSP